MPSILPLNEYVDALKDLAVAAEAGLGCLEATLVSRALDDGPAAFVRATLPLKKRQAGGVFFTPKALAERLVAPYEAMIAGGARVLDPTCGAGDLLLAAANHVVMSENPCGTLAGIDCSDDFVQITEARLRIFFAMQQSGRRATLPPRFHIVAGDGVVDPSIAMLANAELVLMNPPYCSIPAVRGLSWSSGVVSSAAVSVSRIVERCSAGTHVAAILPDVLRTGSRYEHWRSLIASRLCGISLELVDRFDPFADVDVFILRGRVSAEGKVGMDWAGVGAHEVKGARLLRSVATVQVGTVVPHRDVEGADLTAYLAVASAPRFGQVEVGKLPKRGFIGRPFQAPFVVVRRTSSPRDAVRAVPTVVGGTGAVLIENHLLVISPLDGLSSSCEKIARQLASSQTSALINHRIRCRHLTVGALRDLQLSE